MRQSPEQDELHLLEEAELGELDDDTGQVRKERRRKTSAAAETKKKRLSSSEARVSLDCGFDIHVGWGIKSRVLFVFLSATLTCKSCSN